MANSETASRVNAVTISDFTPAFSRAIDHTVTSSKVLQPPSDVAVLSVPAQVQLLIKEGFTVTEIAAELGISASAVQGDLGIDGTNTQAIGATA